MLRLAAGAVCSRAHALGLLRLLVCHEALRGCHVLTPQVQILLCNKSQKWWVLLTPALSLKGPHRADVT